MDAGDPSVVYVQASEVFVLLECCQWFVAQFFLWSPHLLAWLSKRRLIYFFAVCDEQLLIVGCYDSSDTDECK